MTPLMVTPLGRRGRDDPAPTESAHSPPLRVFRLMIYTFCAIIKILYWKSYIGGISYGEH